MNQGPIPAVVAHDLIKKKAMTVGQRITSDLSTQKLEVINAERSSIDIKNKATEKELKAMDSTGSLSNDLILTKDELRLAGVSFSKTLGSKKASEISR